MNKRLKSPISAQIEVTSKCTSECVHCYNFWRKKENNSTYGDFGALNKEDAKIIMQKLANAEIFQVTITGGEPLCNYQTALSCIEFARDLNIGVNLNSNMVLLTKEYSAELKQAGLNHILTSILGPNAEMHDKITQRENSFKKLVDGVKVAKDAGINVSANMVVSQLNWNQVRATAKVVVELGIKSFMATKAGCPGNCFDFSQLAVSHEQLISFLNDLCWVHENLGLKIDILEPLPFCGLLGVKLPNLFTQRRCTAGVTNMTISYDGQVRPCSHLDESYGNMLTEDLETIWAKMSPWSQSFCVPNECLSCKMLSICNSGCRMEAKMRSGRIDGLDPFTKLECVEEVGKMLKSQHKLLEPLRINKFKISKFKVRKESFGGVCSTGTICVYLDHRGFNVLKQLNQETVYDLRTAFIDWNGLDPEKFISGLVRRHVATSL